jgi:hypothetical protein
MLIPIRAVKFSDAFGGHAIVGKRGSTRSLVKSNSYWNVPKASMSGLRQHTIPRFLLRGFADDKGRVHLQRRGQEPVHTNIGNVGVEKGFYNNADDSGADTHITALESEYARLIERLRLTSGAVPSDQLLISEVVHHLSLRTRSLRMWTTNTMEHLLIQVGGQLLDPTIMQRMLSDTQLVTKILIKAMRDLGLSPESATALLPLLLPDIPRLGSEWLGEVPQLIATLLSGAIKELPTGVRIGHNSALVELQDGARQAAYRDLVWHAVTPDHPLVLGDSIVVMEIEGEQPFKALNDAGEELRSVYLPLSATKILVGTRDSAAPAIDARVVNRAIARCSYEFFVSRCPTGDESLGHEISLWAGLLSANQVDHLFAGMSDRWPFNPDAARDSPEYFEPLRPDTFFPIKQ